MESDKNNKKKIIKGLLTDPLPQERKRKLSQLEPVENEMKKQWQQLAKQPVNPKVKGLIWGRIQRKCNGKEKDQVHKELWHFLVASIAILLIIGAFWLIPAGKENAGVENYVEFTASDNHLYLLPDSSKVWMQPGSTLRYARHFSQERKVWLEGNALFEVYKHQGSTFRVYLNKAFIEVKGTCFLVKQDKIAQNEITLFNGRIDFNIEATGAKTELYPLHKIIYNSEKAETHVQTIANISWENGRYNFTDIPLSQLIQTINQMYDTDIILKGNMKKESAFTGSIRYGEPLEDVLDKVCFTLNLHQKEKDNQIIICD